jgi:hypothetical protein
MKTYNFQQQQQGAVLLMSLVLLIVLTLMGISALDSTKLETRMAANVQQDHAAFQAASAGLDQAYHHYVFQGQLNNFENLKDFPENEWTNQHMVILQDSSVAGLTFANDAVANVRVKKIVLDTSQRFFIIESKGRTGCSDGNCKGHETTVVEGWSFKGAKDNNEKVSLFGRCLSRSQQSCQIFFSTCIGDPDDKDGPVEPTDPGDPSCQGTVPAGCRNTPPTATLANGVTLPSYCARIFRNRANGANSGGGGGSLGS